MGTFDDTIVVVTLSTVGRVKLNFADTAYIIPKRRVQKIYVD
jgi:hypothetical protein